MARIMIMYCYCYCYDRKHVVNFEPRARWGGGQIIKHVIRVDDGCPPLPPPAVRDSNDRIACDTSRDFCILLESTAARVSSAGNRGPKNKKKK